MRIGIIDLGTNSVRFDIRQWNRNSSPKKIYSDKWMVRLGQGVFTTGKLHPEAINRTIQALLSFKKNADYFAVDKVIAFGTSALRDARDSKDFIDLVKKKTGFEFKIISGLKEAQLIANGVLANDPKAQDWDKFALVDIGGGSVEITLIKDQKILKSESFDLGVARLNQIFFKTKTLDPVLRLRRHVRLSLKKTFKQQNWSPVKRILGSSGTIKNLIKMGRKDKAFLTRKNLTILCNKMSKLETSELLDLPGIDPQRIDSIFSGALLFSEIMAALKADRAFITDFSLRDGMISHELQRLKSRTPVYGDFDLNEVLHQAKRFSPQVSSQTIQYALKFFDDTAKIHKLPKPWRNHFGALSCLADTGKSISFENFEIHSAYLVRNFEIKNLQEWEKDFIAQICLNQKKQNGATKDFDFKKNKVHTQIAYKMLILYQMGRWISDNFETPILVSKTRAGLQLRPKSLQSKFYTSYSFELDHRKINFEKCFKVKLLKAKT